MPGPTLSWSHSKDGDFTKCKRMFMLKHIDKIPEPPRPLPPGKLEHANDRGSRVHDECERYVNGTSDALPFEAEKFFGPEIDLLRYLHVKGQVSLEGEWALDQDWHSTGWNGEWRELPGERITNIKKVTKLPERGKEHDLVCIGKTVYMWVTSWLRLKLDAIVHLSDEEAIVIDYKTGKKFGNEIKHGEQLQLYALVSFLRFPKLEKVTAELWYFDQNDVTRLTFTRDQALRFRAKWDKRGHSITDCTDFPPSPNVYSCQWCPYAPWGTGHCEVGVRK